MLYPEKFKADGLIELEEELGESSWKNRLVGYCNKGMFVVNKKISNNGYYEFPAELVDWEDIYSVKMKRFFSFYSIFFGCVSALFGIIIFAHGWIKDTITGPGIITIPPIAIIGGDLLIISVKRVQVNVFTNGEWYRYISPLLGYKLAIRMIDDLESRIPKDVITVENRLPVDLFFNNKYK